jgi:hypothetical protein
VPTHRRSLTVWAGDISAAWQSSLDGVVKTGRLLTEAKDQLPHGEFETIVENLLPFGPRTLLLESRRGRIWLALLIEIQ